jgi:hypothetical protein
MSVIDTLISAEPSRKLCARWLGGLSECVLRNTLAWWTAWTFSQGTVAFREIETTGFDPASVFLSIH